MIGRTIPVRGLAAVLALVVLASCRRAPKCEGELERDDLYLLQKLENDGKYPCPEHLQPAIEVRPNGVTLNGKRVASREALPVGTPRRIQGLFNALKQNRETWKQVHPGMSFDAHPKIDIDGACDFGTGAGALMSTAFAGYPNALVRSGGVVFEMYYAVPGPLMPDDQRPRPTELLVVRKGEGRYVPAVRRVETPDFDSDVAKQHLSGANELPVIWIYDAQGKRRAVVRSDVELRRKLAELLE